MEGADLVIISSAGALQFGNIAGQGGGGLGKLVKIFLRWIHRSIEVLFLVECDVYLLTARVKIRK